MPRIGKIENDIPVESFNRIKLEGGYTVELQQGDVQADLVIRTTESMMNRIDVKVDGDQLRITTNLHNVSTDEVKLIITVKNLEELIIEGGVNLSTTGVLNLKDFNLEVKGGANVKMHLNAQDFTARAEGGVNMDFKGSANLFNARTEGAGNIDADNLEAKIVRCRVAGVGNASVYATQELHAHLEGVGKIGYRGNPEIFKEVNGIGVVYRK
jgi:hypothetical protein